VYSLAISNPPKFYFTRKNSFLSLHFFWVRSVCPGSKIGVKNCSNHPLKTSILQWPSKVNGTTIFLPLKAATILIR
ncbi:hypothetical protein RYF04_00140, partial [Wolbachia endosymbiont of Drosophila tristis]